MKDERFFRRITTGASSTEDVMVRSLQFG